VSTNSNSDRLRRIWQVVAVFLVALVVELSLTPHPIELPLEHGDKYEHVLAYAVLMLWWVQVVSGRLSRLGLAAGFVAMAIGLELAQRATGYRSIEVRDKEAGAAGVLLGWALAPPRSPSLIEFARTLLRWDARDARNSSAG
jgi:VanZ family protein